MLPHVFDGGRALNLTSPYFLLCGLVVHMKTIFTRQNIFTLWPSFLNLDGVCERFTWLPAEGVTSKIFSTRFQTYAGTLSGNTKFVTFCH